MLRPKEKFKVIGRPRNRTDARAAVTGPEGVHHRPPGARRPADHGLPGAHAPGHAQAAATTRPRSCKMPGVTHVAQVPTGIAVRAQTFGQCIDAIRAMDVDWNPGPVAGESDKTVLAKLREGELPMVGARRADPGRDHQHRLRLRVPQQRRARAVRRDRRRPQRQGRRSGPASRCRSWPSRTSPRPSACRRTQVKVNVITSGGSFGHKLFGDHAIEAATHLQGHGQAGQADVAPRRRAAPGPPAPDGHLAGPRHRAQRPGAQLRAAPHQRDDRLQPRPRRDDHLAGRRARPDRPGRPRLRRVDLHAHPGAALQLRAGDPAAQRAAGVRGQVQHRLACATSTRPTSASPPS